MWYNFAMKTIIKPIILGILTSFILTSYFSYAGDCNFEVCLGSMGPTACPGLSQTPGFSTVPDSATCSGICGDTRYRNCVYTY